jgi:hypothetical protein
VAGIALSLWVLGTGVYGNFRSVRLKPALPPPASASQLIPLADADGLPDPYLVVVYRLRNTGTAPVTVAAALGSTPLARTTIEPGEARRVDLALERSTFDSAVALQLTGSHASWQVEYVELANLHGFTRGVIEFVILPAGQPVPPPTAWLAAAFGLGGALLVAGVPIPLSRRTRRLHVVVAGLALGLFAIAAASPLVSPFRIALAPHTYAAGLVVLALPQALSLLRAGANRLVALALVAGRWLSTSARMLPRLPWFEIVAAAFFAGFVFLLASRVGGYAGGADQSGYLNGARLLARGDVTVPVRPLAALPREALPTWAYSPLGFRPHGPDTLVPTYPIGLPLVVVGLSLLTTLDAAAHLAASLFAVAGLLLVMWLARACGLSQWGALLAAVILGTSPLYLMMSLQLMSDTPSLVWVTAAILLAWHSRDRRAWALLAGIALAMAVLTRPTNVLAIVPVAIALGVSARRWLWLLAGGLPGATVLVLFNLAAYGSAVTTGYGDYGELFGLRNVGPSLGTYAAWLPVVLTPVGVLALGLPVLLRGAPRTTAMLSAWIAVFLAFYAFYFFTHEAWWFLRFLLPAFPPAIVGSLLVGRALAARIREALGVRVSPALRIAAAGLLAGLIVVHNSSWVRQFDVLTIGAGQGVYAEAAEWARRHLPPSAAIVAMQVSGAFFYYTDLPLLRYDHLDGRAIRRVQDAARAAGQPLYAVLFPFEVEDDGVFRERLPGSWVEIAAVHHITFWEFRGATDAGGGAGSVARDPAQARPTGTDRDEPLPTGR